MWVPVGGGPCTPFVVTGALGALLAAGREMVAAGDLQGVERARTSAER